MKQTIEIEVPDGKKAVWKDNKVVFEDIIPELPKTYEEFYNNYKYTHEEYRVSVNKIRKHGTYNYPSTSAFLSDFKEAESHIALVKLHQLRDCYRQEWKPDWSDGEKKYYIHYWNNKTLSIFSTYQVPQFLSFQTEELAIKFLNNFHNLIKQAGDLI